ncbi:hypothetical protein SRHO_G00146500 [Serrasalmus rhombeus]
MATPPGLVYVWGGSTAGYFLTTTEHPHSPPLWLHSRQQQQEEEEDDDDEEEVYHRWRDKMAGISDVRVCHFLQAIERCPLDLKCI